MLSDTRKNGSIKTRKVAVLVAEGFNYNELIQVKQALKDAGATGIYGSRGANGVILITTKVKP